LLNLFLDEKLAIKPANHLSIILINKIERMLIMSINKKKMQFANFNITYGPNEEPMLEHFEDIIYPAFISQICRERPKDENKPSFYFDNVKIKEIDNDYVMVGNYVKDTQYDVHTTVKEGKLVSSPAHIPTAPYSRYIIFLRNHRMVLVRNESQSPDIRSFQATVRYILNKYIRNANKSIHNKNEKLPHALVNIVDIPLPHDIESVLVSVSKINWIKFRFFPLNNDFNPIPIAQDMDKQMKRLKSKHAHIEFKSPDSKSEIKSLIENSAGLAVATLEVQDSNGNKTKIKQDKFTSNKDIAFERDILDEDDSYIITQAKKDSVINQVSPDNNTLYNRFKKAISKFVN
jgi:hypothetical protein